MFKGLGIVLLAISTAAIIITFLLFVFGIITLDSVLWVIIPAIIGDITGFAIVRFL